jgi:hypothetical protein
MTRERLTLSMLPGRPQLGDEPQDVCEEVPWNCDLGHLEGDIAPVAHHRRADLDQLFLELRQRPILDWLRRRQRTQEVAEIVSERMKRKTHGIGGEGAA